MPTAARPSIPSCKLMSPRSNNVLSLSYPPDTERWMELDGVRRQTILAVLEIEKADSGDLD